MRILLTGGAGYIGSHSLANIFESGFKAIVLDDLSTGSAEAVNRVGILCGQRVDLITGNVSNYGALEALFEDFLPDAVIHFAGKKVVNESLEKPLYYYDENIGGVISLLRAMDHVGCRKIVFSSSASIYGPSEPVPIQEDSQIFPSTPYGRSKYFNEQIIRDWSACGSNRCGVILRYFNPVGAHESGVIGESLNGLPSNIMPFIVQVAAGELPELLVYGDDYATRDGTGERDFIHVQDLAKAHTSALKYCLKSSGCEAINVGTGKGVTVRELIFAFESATGRKVPYRIVERRPGDIPRSVACVEKAKSLLGWTAGLGVQEMCKSAWNWKVRNPFGYG